MWEQFQFAEINRSVLFFFIPALLVLFAYAFHKKDQALKLFANPAMHALLFKGVSRKRQWLKLILLLFVVFFLVLTLMRPQGDPVTQEVEKRGRDLVFVLDISRSMLAEDLAPNRLERAKDLINGVVDILEGDRVGLLIFAGSTAIKVPLTLDYYYFKNALRKISTDDISRGGTHIGDAIRNVSERLFYDEDNKYRDLILITDGEDHDSFPVQAAEEAKKKGIRIHTVGLGDPDGSNIPLREGKSYKLLKHNNQMVKTKLDESTLKKISAITNGVFIPVRTNLVDLNDLYIKYIAVEEKREVATKQSKVWRELFQFFLAISIILLMIEALISERSTKGTKSKES